MGQLVLTIWLGCKCTLKMHWYVYLADRNRQKMAYLALTSHRVLAKYDEGKISIQEMADIAKDIEALTEKLNQEQDRVVKLSLQNIQEYKERTGYKP